MRNRLGMFPFFAAISTAIMVHPVQVHAKIDYLKTRNFVVSYETISKREAEEFAVHAEQALSSITAFLGTVTSRQIRVTIREHVKFPKFDQDGAEILIPPTRIENDEDQARANSVRQRGTALVSLIVPVVAPSKNVQWGGFLETGLRVFLQEKLGKNELRPFPTLGRDLHIETATLASDYGRMIPIAEVERARTWRTKLTRTRRLAYLEAGSFVRFLVEQRGLNKFLDWYNGQRFEEVYDEEILQAEKEWTSYIRDRHP